MSNFDDLGYFNKDVCSLENPLCKHQYHHCRDLGANGLFCSREIGHLGPDVACNFYTGIWRAREHNYSTWPNFEDTLEVQYNRALTVDL